MHCLKGRLYLLRCILNYLGLNCLMICMPMILIFEKYGMHVTNVHLVTFIGMRDFYSREINNVCVFVLFVNCWLGKVREVVL